MDLLSIVFCCVLVSGFIAIFKILFGLVTYLRKGIFSETKNSYCVMYIFLVFSAIFLGIVLIDIYNGGV